MATKRVPESLAEDFPREAARGYMAYSPGSFFWDIERMRAQLAQELSDEIEGIHVSRSTHRWS